jgi:pilus assembly protein Flp/PilA
VSDIMHLLKKLLLDSRGASAAEYAMILAIVGAGISVAAVTLGGSISNSMNNTSEKVRTCGGSGC